VGVGVGAGGGGGSGGVGQGACAQPRGSALAAPDGKGRRCPLAPAAGRALDAARATCSLWAQAKLEAARQKATSIAAQEDVPMASKMREIEKLYAKARAAGGKGKKGKGGGKDGKRRGPPLDKRMLKDKRGQAKAGGKRGGGGKKGRGGSGGGGKAGGGGKGGGKRR
jgi:hypothetical protein